MKVERDCQGTYQLLTGPPGGSQQALPHLTMLTAHSPSPRSGSSTASSSVRQRGRMNGHQEEIISLPSQRQEGGEEISIY